MKIYKKVILILFLIITTLILFTSNTFASILDTEYYNPGQLTDRDTARIANMTGTILGTIRNVGIVSSVVALSIIGLKYILGSLDEKANYKENMTPYVIGCFLLAMATTIPSIIYDILY